MEASEINNLISSIKDRSAKLVVAMNGASIAAGEQDNVVLDTRKAFDEIYSTITEISMKISTTRSHLEAMDEDKNNIVELVHGINSISEEIISSSENVQNYTDQQIVLIKQVNDSVEGLSNLSKSLDESVEIFRN